MSFTTLHLPDFRQIQLSEAEGWRREVVDVGTVVHVYRDRRAYEVEFTTLPGKTATVVTFEAADVRLVGKREITHARELEPA